MGTSSPPATWNELGQRSEGAHPQGLQKGQGPPTASAVSCGAEPRGVDPDPQDLTDNKRAVF